eukprot:3713529-Rhodomonas_salina.2
MAAEGTGMLRPAAEVREQGQRGERGGESERRCDLEQRVFQRVSERAAVGICGGRVRVGVEQGTGDGLARDDVGKLLHQGKELGLGVVAERRLREVDDDVGVLGPKQLG